MRVLKFGGSSVADATRMSGVIDIVCGEASSDRVIVVSSAISGCTDALIEIGKTDDLQLKGRLVNALKDRHMQIVRRLFTGSERAEAENDVLNLFEELSCAEPQDCVTFGELFSTRILARKLECEGINTQWLDSRKLVVTVEGVVDTRKTYSNIFSAVASCPQARIFVAPGFIASDASGRVTTLGRGGSDYSASLFAAGAKADTLEIWTDVPGIMTANPKVVPSAVTIPYISYQAALDLASAGAKVLYAPTVKPAMEAGLAINIRNTFDPKNPGTVISGSPAVKAGSWMGVTSLNAPDGRESVICLVGESVPGRQSCVRRIKSALSDSGISAIGDISGEGSLFYVNVRSTVVNEAVAAIHREFFESRSVSVINVFIAGYGAVGHALADLVCGSSERILKRTGRTIRIVGVSDSRHYVIDMGGLHPGEMDRMLGSGWAAASNAYIDEVCMCAPRKSVFVDCTDDHNLYKRYHDLFSAGVSVVTSNRRSLSISYVSYAALKQAARENGVFFRYDTTVGTSLPVLESIAGDANCSDGIVSIEAVVSCTLNYIITGYDGPRTESLATLLKRAQDEGLTERDPRVDLGGEDVLRKLLILAREAGVPLEAADVEIEPMLGPEFFNCPLDEFYTRLAEYEPHFVEREDELDRLGMRQRFVASIVRDPHHPKGYRAEIKMRMVDADSPFFRVAGTENIIRVCSEHSAPLVIKGSGEGAYPAASGIIRDILMQ